MKPRHDLPWRLVLVAVAFSCLVPERVAATIVVAVRTPHELVVAADSKQVRSDGATRFVCKIRRMGDRGVLATSGSVAMDGGADLGDVLFRAARADGALPDVQRLESLAAQTLQSFVSGPGTTMATLGFFRMVADTPELKLRKLLAVDQGPVHISRTDCPSSDPKCGSGKGILRFAYGDDAAVAAVDLAAASESARWAQALAKPDGIPASIERLMRAAIAAAPEACGHPIAMVKIDVRGVTWIQPGECEGE